MQFLSNVSIRTGASVRQQQLLQRLAAAGLGLATSGDLVLVKNAVDQGKEPRQLVGEFWMVLRGFSKGEKLLTNQIVKCAPDTETPFDRARRAALLDPDRLESQGGNIPRCGRRPSGASGEVDVVRDPFRLPVRAIAAPSLASKRGPRSFRDAVAWLQASGHREDAKSTQLRFQ
jgi:hypothetical protein